MQCLFVCLGCAPSVPGTSCITSSCETYVLYVHMHVVNVLFLLIDYGVHAYFLWAACSRSPGSYFVEMRSRKGERWNVNIKFSSQVE